MKSPKNLYGGPATLPIITFRITLNHDLLGVESLRMMLIRQYAKCHFAEYYNAECRYAVLI